MGLVMLFVILNFGLIRMNREHLSPRYTTDWKE